MLSMSKSLELLSYNIFNNRLNVILEVFAHFLHKNELKSVLSGFNLDLLVFHDFYDAKVFVFINT